MEHFISCCSYAQLLSLGIKSCCHGGRVRCVAFLPVLLLMGKINPFTLIVRVLNLYARGSGIKTQQRQ